MNEPRQARRSPLALAVEQFERRRDEAAAASRQTRSALDDAARTLTTLEEYTAELARRRRDGGGALARTGAGLANATAFASRLVEAVDAQSRKVEASREAADRARAALVEQQRRLKAIEALIEARARALIERDARRDRREIEEWGNARFAQAKAKARRANADPVDAPTQDLAP